MKHISILVPKDAILSNIEGPRQLFQQVNDILASRGGAPMFRIQLVGLTKETKLNGELFTIHSDLMEDVKKTDLIIIPAITGDLSAAITANSSFTPWIIKQHQAGAEIASLCLGAFLLASSGLIDGSKCATHWMFAQQFKAMFPQVNLVDDCIITDEKGIYTSGGAYSFLNLLLYLVEKFAGREMAILASKVFAIEIERQSQSPFIIFKGQKEHGDAPVKQAQEFIEQNFQERITVDQLAGMLLIGRRNLERRFKKATSNTVVEYIQRVKVEAAKLSLESSRENVNEVMYNVGYTDPKAFRTVFNRITGLSPVQYRNKFRTM